jgi:hypothetical protein
MLHISHADDLAWNTGLKLRNQAKYSRVREALVTVSQAVFRVSACTALTHCASLGVMP